MPSTASECVYRERMFCPERITAKMLVISNTETMSAVRVIKVRLTKKGKAAFRKSTVKITAKGTFASAGRTTTKVKRFTLKP